MPANQSEPVKSQTNIPEDEIELIDLLRVIWKWRYLVIIGTAVSALAAVAISFNIQPIYQAKMVLKPGIYKVGSDGKRDYLDSVEEIKTLIEDELLFKVLDHSKNQMKTGSISSKAFKITANKNSNTLRILYESKNREESIENLNFLSNMLSERYESRLKFLQGEYEYKLMTKRRQLEFRIDEEKFITSKLRDIQKRLDRNTPENEPNTLLDYASIIGKIAELKQKHAKVDLQISLDKKNIADLEKEMIGKQAIIVVQPATASHNPIKPKKKRIVLLAALTGIFVMVFLSLIIEYITKNIKKRNYAKTDG